MKSKGKIAMKTQEIIKALRATPSRSKRTLLDKAADRLEQLQNNQRWYNPKDKLPESDCGVLAIVSGKPRPNITLVEAYCIAEYDVQDEWIVSDYPECTSLKIEAWMPLPYYQGEWEE